MNFNTLMLHGVIEWQIFEVQKTHENSIKYQRLVVKTEDGEFAITMFFDPSEKKDHEKNNF